MTHVKDSSRLAPPTKENKEIGSNKMAVSLSISYFLFYLFTAQPLHRELKYHLFTAMYA